MNRYRRRKRIGRYILAGLILAILFCMHFAAPDWAPAPKRSAPSGFKTEFTADQICTMRANGRLLSERALVP